MLPIVMDGNLKIPSCGRKPKPFNGLYQNMMTVRTGIEETNVQYEKIYLEKLLEEVHNLATFLEGRMKAINLPVSPEVAASLMTQQIRIRLPRHPNHRRSRLRGRIRLSFMATEIQYLNGTGFPLPVLSMPGFAEITNKTKFQVCHLK